MQTNKTKHSKLHRVVAGVAITAAVFTGVGITPPANALSSDEVIANCHELNLAVAVDHTSSFSDSMWESQKQALKQLVRELSKNPSGTTISFFNFAKTGTVQNNMHNGRVVSVNPTLKDAYDFDLSKQQGIEDALNYLDKMERVEEVTDENGKDHNNQQYQGTNWGAAIEKMLTSGRDFNAVLFSSDGGVTTYEKSLLDRFGVTYERGDDREDQKKYVPYMRQGLQQINDGKVSLSALFISDDSDFISMLGIDRDVELMGLLVDENGGTLNKNVFVTQNIADYANGFVNAASAVCLSEDQKLDSFADLNDPGYPVSETIPGEMVTVTQNGDNDLPVGTKFQKINEPTGWTVSVNKETGEISATPPTDTPAGIYQVSVEVVYPDYSREKVPAFIKVNVDGQEVGKFADHINPGYEETKIQPGKTATVGQTKDNVPDGTTYKIDPNFKIPDGWTIDANPTTGEITYTAPKGAKEGDAYTIPVIVTYPDGSTDNVESKITVLAPDVTQADENNPGYKPAETKPGTPVSIDQDGDTELPDGTKFGTPDKTPEGWEVKVDEKTGKVTVTPPKDAKPGDKGEFTVPVTYPDGSKDNADVVVTVKDKGDDTGDGDKGDGSGDGDNTGGNDGDKTPGDNTGDGDKDNGSGDGDKGDGDNTGGNDGDNTGGNNAPGDNTGDNTKRPDFSGLPNDDGGKGTENGDGRDGGDKSDNSDKPSGAKVVDNGNKQSGNTGSGGTGNGGVKGGFKPVAPANPSRVNQAPSAPSGFAPITGPGVGTVLAGGSGSGAGKGAVVDTGGQVQESFWTKIANLFR